MAQSSGARGGAGRPDFSFLLCHDIGEFPSLGLSFLGVMGDYKICPLCRSVVASAVRSGHLRDCLS